MQKNPKLSKLSFSITPNELGYIVACKEMPYLFTDVPSVQEIDKKIRQLVSEYMEYFPHDAEKRGVNKDIAIETTWVGRPNSVALN
ncbi:MAG: hypothetical protein HY295_04005 [Thaumarchaeota archaeon]|nr:hypothetical protein [Nitrososphaerota archaeon]